MIVRSVSNRTLKWNSWIVRDRVQCQHYKKRTKKNSKNIPKLSYCFNVKLIAEYYLYLKDSLIDNKQYVIIFKELNNNLKQN